MSLKQLAEETTTALINAVEDHDISERQKQALRALVENSIVRAVEQAREIHKEATVVCCGPEADMAHKIEEEAELKTKALISNLSALR